MVFLFRVERPTEEVMTEWKMRQAGGKVKTDANTEGK